jgi:hypothetical protein
MGCAILRSAAAATVISFTLLILSCGGNAPAPAASDTGRPVSSSASAPPSMPSTSGGPPAETPTGSATGNDLATWLAHANNACQAAISGYQQAKAEIGSDNPEGLAAAAALATGRASNKLADMTAPTAEAMQMTAQVREFAAGEQAMASAVRSGSVSDESSALDQVEAAGRKLAATASALGAGQCAAMTHEV